MLAALTRTATAKAATHQTARTINTTATRKSIAAASESSFSNTMGQRGRRMGASDVASLIALTAGGIWLGKEALGEVKEFGPGKK